MRVRPDTLACAFKHPDYDIRASRVVARSFPQSPSNSYPYAERVSENRSERCLTMFHEKYSQESKNDAPPPIFPQFRLSPRRASLEEPER